MSAARDNPDKPMISVIAPLYNEAGVLARFVERVRKALQQLDDRYVTEIILSTTAAVRLRHLRPCRALAVRGTRPVRRQAAAHP
jgi:hypothetical protein